ncbi:methyl-accepting chemotaxis protein [Povalibacter uvarum]|uniref:Methyl-accepting chemotaxis protein n=1 Tax=Povalibacter uvarum TaxID=732238 RepID=A0A841HVZ6_9GAMM|nr:methyl-accepting chemotaxis protein [Povalibacter uvarum]MBB6096429.1 methyl-accepting chemotaxis protein [Povalibacter uvarum]
MSHGILQLSRAPEAAPSRSLRTRIAIIVSAVLLPLSLLLAFYFWRQEDTRIRTQASAQAERELAGLLDLLTLTDQQLQARVQSGMKLLQARSQALGAASAGPVVTVKDKSAPDLVFGGQPQAQHYSLVDGVAEINGGTVTLFSKSGDQFVRVATNVMVDQQRAIGTVLDPSGRAMAAIREGRAFYGQVDILGNPYITGYEPIRDVRGDVIGIWYVGFKVDLQPLEQTVGRARLLTGGVIAVVDDKGKLRFRSNGIDEDVALTAIDPPQSGWVRLDKTFDAWNFKVVAAYPAAEVASLARNAGIGIMSGALVVGGVLLFVLLSLIQRLVLKPIGGEPRVAMTMMTRIAHGELAIDNRIEAGNSVIGECARMSAKLADIVGSVRRASESVGVAARQISQGNDDLSERTQQQAAALEETASSMEEMTATVRQNSESARRANQRAAAVRDHAGRSTAVVTRTVEAMSEIDVASRKVSDIIGVIDEIAFQTNLLALNAAVEAARAGEQGRGFAVVAAEVRSLAQRSATAAKEIKDLIGNSLEKVRAGSALVQESGKALHEIMDGVRNVSDIVAQIADASEEQASGIEQVNKAITQMDQSTQQNAALVEEAAAAAKTMEQQSQQLIREVAYFRTGESDAIAGVSGASAASVEEEAHRAAA